MAWHRPRDAVSPGDAVTANKLKTQFANRYRVTAHDSSICLSPRARIKARAIAVSRSSSVLATASVEVRRLISLRIRSRMYPAIDLAPQTKQPIQHC